jgi:hypothetical protein
MLQAQALNETAREAIVKILNRGNRAEVAIERGTLVVIEVKRQQQVKNVLGWVEPDQRTNGYTS